ncbi:MAG: hypothetical protein QOF66_7230 [Mycobacterium sp.]|jgi:hypothetical protein|nr:hypothetical protein [Mycobacterium sp.]MDT5058864.1 hypothetical protein [Mycobacterium sp.]
MLLRSVALGTVGMAPREGVGSQTRCRFTVDCRQKVARDTTAVKVSFR